MKSQKNLAVANLKTVFSQKKNMLIAAGVAVLFYIVNVMILEYQFFFYGFSKGVIEGFVFMCRLLVGFYHTVLLHTFITTVITSILFGVLFTLVLCKTKFAKSTDSKKTGVIASVGIFLGILAPGCAACGVGLISLLGLSAAFITIFPFDGLEISVIAILIMLYAIMHFAKNLNVCKIT